MSPVKNEENGNPIVDPDMEVTMQINRNITHQTIDGFGFFGARDIWWTDNQDNLYSDEWAQMIIEDLGLTIWRNEYYPPATPEQSQDADWEKQKPVVEGIATAAENAGVDLKMIYSVWSPPADMKVAISDDEDWPDYERLVGVPHPDGTKEGGALDPTKHEEFGNWLADGIALYEELGIDLYAISPQNEPFFEQPFNSCFYHPEWYTEMLEKSIPVVRERYPDIKVFGGESMLHLEVQPWFHHNELIQPDNEDARNQLDIWAVHGYIDGVNPTSASDAADYWEFHYKEYAEPTGKPQWMTETSGFYEHWLRKDDNAGALELSLAMHAALHFGNISAWVWWQGSQLGEIGRYNLMEGEANPGKKYHVSKQFFRFIRPGAERVDLQYNENDEVFATAYQHDEMDTFTIVAINTNDESVLLNLDGDQLPGQFDQYVTTTGQNTNKTEGVSADRIILPPLSVVTLVDGNVYEHIKN